MSPEIHILHLIPGAQAATGLVIIIDVCRAFSTAAYLADCGCQQIIMVSTLEEAVALKTQHADALLVGEVKGRKPEGFDFGNSPTEIIGSNIESSLAIQRTSAGTQGIVNARRADEILTGAFVNAGAIVRYVEKRSPQIVSLVCMGWEAERECVEDTLCAEFLRDRILGTETDFEAIREKISQSETGDKFRDLERPWMPESDLNFCLTPDVFDFVLRWDRSVTIPRLNRYDI